MKPNDRVQIAAQIEGDIGAVVNHVRPWKHGVLFSPAWPSEVDGKRVEGRAWLDAPPLDI